MTDYNENGRIKSLSNAQKRCLWYSGAGLKIRRSEQGEEHDGKMNDRFVLPLTLDTLIARGLMGPGEGFNEYLCTTDGLDRLARHRNAEAWT